MKHVTIPACIGLLFSATTALAIPVLAVQGGMLRTMPHGLYECAVPGAANGDAWIPVEGANFSLESASSYRSDGGKGTYLMKGKEFVFTRGPKKGERFRRSGENRLRQLNTDGTVGRMLCVRRGGSTF